MPDMPDDDPPVVFNVLAHVSAPTDHYPEDWQRPRSSEYNLYSMIPLDDIPVIRATLCL